ncbi:hypothetical protein SAMN02745226_01657, partial [Fervidobacterium gondwanense DSM 13020]
MDSRKFATVSQAKTKFRQPNCGGRENRIPNCIYLCLFWKARVRKEPLSERDGN